MPAAGGVFLIFQINLSTNCNIIQCFLKIQPQKSSLTFQIKHFPWLHWLPWLFFKMFPDFPWFPWLPWLFLIFPDFPWLHWLPWLSRHPESCFYSWDVMWINSKWLKITINNTYIYSRIDLHLYLDSIISRWKAEIRNKYRNTTRRPRSTNIV